MFVFRERIVLRLPYAAAAILLLSASAGAATFGTVLPVRGHVSDIALDPTRNLLYAANFTANRIEILSLSSQALQSPINVAAQPSALAVSPDGQFLVVGHYGDGNPSASVAITIINLNTGALQTISLGTTSVLAAAFGNGSKALIVTTSGVSLLDPASGTLTALNLTNFSSTPLPVPWATYPAGIISGSAGVSGDGNVIYALIDVQNQSTYIQYNVANGTLFLAGSISAPPNGPRVISVDQTGANFLAGWGLENLQGGLLAQFPYPPGVLYQGGHAFDWQNNLIYAQVAGGTIQAVAAGAATTSTTTASTLPLLQIFDSDNLTVRETFNLSENLAGKALLSGNFMYAISDSGLTIFPTGALASVHRVKAVQEDLLFQSSGCALGLLSQYVDIVDPGGNATDFTLSASSSGVTFSATSGTTPAHVQVFVNPTVFENQNGTTVVPVQITSSLAVDVPEPVRILINTKNPDQQGAIYDVPGTIVDVLADPARDRFYVLRQDRNQVLVFDGTAMTQVATLRTGNTPMQMAIYQDQLLVTNDNSQLVNVFDLPTLTARSPVWLSSVPSSTPTGSTPSIFCSDYARSIVAAGNRILATSRNVGNNCVPGGILSIDLPDRIATAADTFIYTNTVDPNSALAGSPSGQSIFLTMPDGTVALYDTPSGLFLASRKDIGAVSGAYAALSDTAFFTGNFILGPSLVPQGQINLQGGISSGAAFVGGGGLLSSTPSGGVSGVIQRFSLSQLTSISPARTAEAPDLAQSITRTPLGQTGQTILPFTRTFAPLSNGNFFIQLSTSGFTAIPVGFAVPSQPPTIAAVTNAADETPAVAPGGLINVWGAGLSDGSAAALSNSCLYANSIPVPLLYVSPGQINAQLPFNLGSSANLVLSNANGTSAPFSLTTLPNAPAVFRTAGGTPDIVREADGKPISASSPIYLNDKLDIYVTGLGAVAPSAIAGVPTPSNPLAVTTTVPAVFIGPTQLFTLWAGLEPGQIGVYRITVQVPYHNIPTGSKIQFTVLQGDYQTVLMVPVSQ